MSLLALMVCLISLILFRRWKRDVFAFLSLVALGPYFVIYMEPAEDACVTAPISAADGMRWQFFLIAVEKSGPYEVGVHQIPAMWLAMGERKAAEARRIYKECVESGDWPGYDPSVQFLDAPTWLVFEHETRYENQEIRF